MTSRTTIRTEDPLHRRVATRSGAARRSPRLRTAAVAALLSLVPGCYLAHGAPGDEPLGLESSCDGHTICGACVEGACDVDTGEGCAEGEGCYVTTSATGVSSTLCLPSGELPVDAACTATTDCESGFTCLMGPELGPGFCAPPCCDDSSCPAGMECFGFGALRFCARPSRSCDVVRQTGCEPGTACYPAPAPTCVRPGILPAGAACLGATDCAPGLSCLFTEEGGYLCRPLCTVSGDCEAGQRCEIVLPDNVGYCRD